MVAAIGISGCSVAYFTYQFTGDWRLCYKIGGAWEFYYFFYGLAL